MVGQSRVRSTSRGLVEGSDLNCFRRGSSVAATGTIWPKTVPTGSFSSGSNGRTGLAYILLGSVADRVVHKARCPVLTVRHPDGKFKHPLDK